MKLSTREIEILHLVAYEKTSREISELLNLSVETIKSHRKNLQGKLAARNTAGMVRRGFETGFLRNTGANKELDQMHKFYPDLTSSK